MICSFRFRTIKSTLANCLLYATGVFFIVICLIVNQGPQLLLNGDEKSSCQCSGKQLLTSMTKNDQHYRDEDYNLLTDSSARDWRDKLASGDVQCTIGKLR